MTTKKPYLDRHSFHEELTICKKQDELTSRALTMFQTLAKEVSKGFYFENDEDRKDAVSVAVHDLFKYWRNFKESNVVQLKINRNFVPTENIEVHIHGYGKLKYVASRKNDPEKRMFLIGDTINNSLKNLTDVIEEVDGSRLVIYTDKIKNKITLMDKFNSEKEERLREQKGVLKETMIEIKKEKSKEDIGKNANKEITRKIIEGLEDKKKEILNEIEELSVKSYVIIKSKKVKGDKDKKEIYFIKPNEEQSSKFEFEFKEPPNAFSYFTSIARNGILKSINKINPKHFRNGNLISIDQINKNNNGMYSI